MSRRSAHPTQRGSSHRPLKKLWHTPAVILLEATAPYSHDLLQELHLRRQPQRIDLLILRRRQQLQDEITHLEALYSRLQDVNLIEIKGGSDQVERLDVHSLLSYASQLRLSIDKPPRRAANPDRANPDPANPDRANLEATSYFLGIPPLSAIQLVVLAPLLLPPFRTEVLRCDGALEEVSRGVWQGRLAGLPLLFLETERLWDTSDSNRLFYLLTRGIFEAPDRLGELTVREKMVYTEVATWLIQSPPIVMGGDMRVEKLREYQERELARKQAWLNSLPPEERLRGLGPDELLKRLKPEERLRGLGPEERLYGLSPEDRAALARVLKEN